MAKIEAIIFDADGTLLNTFELIVSAYEHVAKTHKLRVPTVDEIRSHLGNSLPDIFTTLYPHEDIQSLLYTNDEYIAANVMKSEAFSGVKELLISLTKQGIQLGILTSGGAKVSDVLKRHDIDAYFASIVHHERIVHPKPDPSGFLLACKECKADPHKSVMVGDMVTDIETGKNANALATIAVTHGFSLKADLANAHPDYIAHDISEIGKAIASIG